VILHPREFVKSPAYFGPAPRKIRNRQKIWQAGPGLPTPGGNAPPADAAPAAGSADAA
jgi:hypothetical protein